ncbi:FAD-dependent oxidoreductase, partial [Candidatus Thiosymbion oneisti]|uniref:FAD-dependent oxidoreductase n=1 Tax=Candidatus Thiosymbion oneisti TaxID=589554 RepID=UPI000B7CDF1C
MVDKAEDKPVPDTGRSPDCIVIGAGPAGLAAALEFLRHGHVPLVLEKDSIVGGIARTESYQGFSFDMGGHRFFTKSDYVKGMWQDLLGEDFLLRSRLSRIFYRHKFFAYPPRLWDALMGLGPWESIRILASYLRWQLLPYRQVTTFEHWVTNAFGKCLFEHFFKTYTEKVWGIPCNELRAEWAAQRIRGLSLGVVIKNLVRKTGTRVTTLIDQFHYPRFGPGMMWEAARRRIHGGGGEVRMNTDVIRVHRNRMHIDRIVVREGEREYSIAAELFVSSMPLSELVGKLDPPPPPPVLAAAGNLKHRGFLTVCLIVDGADLFPDNWIYVHEPGVQVARIQNYTNWSKAMVADETKSGLGLEYFCNEGDELWCMDDTELIALAGRELETIGLLPAGQVIDGQVYRIADA